MNLLLSICTLVLGPFVYSLGRWHAQARQFLDGFVFITVAGIVCVHIIPAALLSGGFWALLFLVLGLAFPVILERVFDRALHQAHRFIVLLAAAGLVVHAVLDGVALLPAAVSSHAPAEGAWSNQLAWGVILHRLPIGMAIWWSLRPQFGTAAAIGIFAVIIVATAASYWFAGPIVALAEARSLGYFQSFVAGSLVHVVAFGVSHSHDHHVEPAPIADAWGHRLGVLVGMFVVFTLPHVYPG